MDVGRGCYTEKDLRDRLRSLEETYGRDSEDFIAEWEAGRLPYTDDYFVWAGLCHRLGISGGDSER